VRLVLGEFDGDEGLGVADLLFFLKSWCLSSSFAASSWSPSKFNIQSKVTGVKTSLALERFGVCGESISESTIPLPMNKSNEGGSILSF
jgi:hypothetical protein